MKFIYKNLLVEVILNLDANLIMAFCTGADASKYKTGIKSGKTIKTVRYRDLSSIKFSIVESIDTKDENLSLSFIMKKICIKIDEHFLKR